jgi:hypothetical protein
LENLKGGDQLEDLDRNEITLKWILSKQCWFRVRTAVESSEYSNDPSDSKNGGNFLSSWVTISFLQTLVNRFGHLCFELSTWQPHTPSWHSALLFKHRDNFTFTFTVYIAVEVFIILQY